MFLFGKNITIYLFYFVKKHKTKYVLWNRYIDDFYAFPIMRTERFSNRQMQMLSIEIQMSNLMGFWFNFLKFQFTLVI